MQVVANAGVDSKFQKFVFSEVSKEGNFEDNLKEYLKNNNQYLIKEEKTKTTGYSQNTSNSQISEEKAYLDKTNSRKKENEDNFGMNVKIKEVFIQAFIELFYDYKNYLTVIDGKPIFNIKAMLDT